MALVELLPILVNIFAIILLIVLIILGIKLIIILNRTDKLVQDVQEKVSSLNSVFNIITLANDKVGYIINRTVEIIMDMVNKIFKKRKENDENE